MTDAATKSEVAKCTRSFPYTVNTRVGTSSIMAHHGNEHNDGSTNKYGLVLPSQLAANLVQTQPKA